MVNVFTPQNVSNQSGTITNPVNYSSPKYSLNQPIQNTAMSTPMTNTDTSDPLHAIANIFTPRTTPVPIRRAFETTPTETTAPPVVTTLANAGYRLLEAVPRMATTIFGEAKGGGKPTTVQANIDLRRFGFDTPNYVTAAKEQQDAINKGENPWVSGLNIVSNKTLDVAFGASILSDLASLSSKVMLSGGVEARVEAQNVLDAAKASQKEAFENSGTLPLAEREKVMADLANVKNQAQKVISEQGAPTATDFARVKASRYLDVLGRQTPIKNVFSPDFLKPNMGLKSTVLPPTPIAGLLPGSRNIGGTMPVGLSTNAVEPVGTEAGGAITDSTAKIPIDTAEQNAINGAAKILVPDIVGERNVRVGQVNQLAETLKKTLTLQEQEALTFMRDYQDNPQGLQQLTTNPKLEKYKPLIQLAQNPTPAMVSADKVITDYFNKALTEGKNLGFLDSEISTNKYTPHLLAPADQVAKTTGIGAGTLGRSTPFAKSRTYNTVADAIQNGVKVKSLNALDALKIYGSKHAIAASTNMAVQSLKDSELGKWGFKGSENIPEKWVVADPSNRFFRNTVPFTTKEGKPSFAYQDLYVPPEIAKALKPLVATDFTGQLPGFSKTRLYQSYIKTIQLGLSIFHLKALTLTALNNAGATGVMKSIFNHINSVPFRATELDFIKHGGISPILGQTIEAYKGLVETSIPSRLDILKGITGIKAMDYLSKKLTNFTFNVVQRKDKITDYALKTAKWIAENPDASDIALVAAKRSIAKEVNAAYGGLNWEMLGWNKATLNVTRFLMLAPDWTFSNFFNTKYAFQGGEAGSSARKFWIRSAITGAILTYGMSTLINGKPPKPSFQTFTSVYMGKDKYGKDIYQNWFFAGAPSDAITLINNVSDYGVIQGFMQSLASKASPAIRTAIQLATNRNYLGQQIIPKGMGVVAGTARSLYTLLVGVSPVPFTVSTPYQMFTDPNKQYSAKEYLTSLLGTKPRHVIPSGMRQVTSGSRKGQLVPATTRTANPFIKQVTTGQINAPIRSSGNPFSP
jgi:hypothetical protein